MNHTPEPWPPYVDVAVVMSPDPNGPDAAVLSFENYQRAKVCVDACVGIPTELLEAMKDFEKAGVQTVNSVLLQRDQLLAALEESRRYVAAHTVHHAPEDGGPWSVLEQVDAAIAAVKGGAA